MNLTVVSAGVCNLVHRKGGGGQEVTGVFRPGADEIRNDTGAVQLPIDMLERRTAEARLLCKFIRGMVQVRFVIHLAPDAVEQKKMRIAVLDGFKLFT